MSADAVLRQKFASVWGLLDEHTRRLMAAKVERWAIEAGTPNVLLRRGATKDSLRPGTVVIVDGYRAKDGSLRANGRDLTFPDGRILFVGSSGTGAPYEISQGVKKKQAK